MKTLRRNKTQSASESCASTASKFKVLRVESASAYVPHVKQPVRALSSRIASAAPSSRHFFNSPRALISG